MTKQVWSCVLQVVCKMSVKSDYKSIRPEARSTMLEWLKISGRQDTIIYSFSGFSCFFYWICCIILIFSLQQEFSVYRETLFSLPDNIQAPMPTSQSRLCSSALEDTEPSYSHHTSSSLPRALSAFQVSVLQQLINIVRQRIGLVFTSAVWLLAHGLLWDFFLSGSHEVSRLGTISSLTPGHSLANSVLYCL